MSLSSSNYAADAYVTAANPAPGRPELVSYPIRSGTGWTEGFVTKSDGGIGLNVYVAGGTGPLGVIPVSQTNPTQISLSGVTIGGVIEVTSSQANPVWMTGSVYVINQTSGSGGISGTITATITGVVEVSQTNVQTTQSVYILQQPVGVTGNVGISGTASVRVESFGGPVEVTGVVTVSQSNLPLTQSVYVVNQTSGNVTVSGTASVSVTNFPPVVTVSGTGAFDVTVLNLPATQSVFVVNPASSSITGTVTVSGTGVFQVTGSVFVLNPSSASLIISGALEVTSSQASPVWVTGNLGTGGGTTVIFAAAEPSPSASTVTTIPQTASVVLLMGPADRLGYTIFNTSSANLSLYFGPATGTASYYLVPGAVYEAQDIVFIGSVYGKWSSGGSGAAVITEYFGNTSGSASVTVNVGNFPVTQSVYVVNPTSSSLSGVNVVSGALQITGSVSIVGFSASLSMSSVVEISGVQAVNGALPVSIVSGGFSGSFNIVQPTTSSKGVFPFQSASTDVLLNSNANRVTFSIFNDTDQTYLVCLGPSASLTDFDLALFPQQYYENPYPSWRGIVTGIGFMSGTGNVRVKELLP